MATMTTAEMRTRIRRHMPGAEGEQLIQALDAMQTDITTAQAAAVAADARVTALVADYNTLVAKLNADAGVTDTDYATSSA